MNDEMLEYISMMKQFNSELMELNIKYSDQIEKYKDIVLDLENERDILKKSKLSETKAKLKYIPYLMLIEDSTDMVWSS